MNTTVCDEATAKFMSEALLNHAREVSRYARTYPEVFESLPVERARDSVAKFIKNVSRMIKEFQALMLMAKYKGVTRFCNREQIEAYVENASEIVADVEKRHRESGNPINAMPALLN